MFLETIKYDVKDKVAMITFNRPEKRNAFNTQMILDLKTATYEAFNDDTVRCVILTGEGLGF